MDRREVDDVEPELGQVRQDLRDALEAAPGAREELVPGTEARSLPLDVELERRLPAASAPPGPRRELGRRVAPVLDLTTAEERLALGEIAGQVGLTRGDLAVVLGEPGRVRVEPRLDVELPAAEIVGSDLALPAVVAADSLSGASRQRRVTTGRNRTRARSTSCPSRTIVAPTGTVSPAHALAGQRPQSTCGVTSPIQIRLAAIVATR